MITAPLLYEQPYNRGVFVFLNVSYVRKINQALICNSYEERRQKTMKVISIDKAPWEGPFEEKEMREAFWHTSSHILAQAVKRLYPKTRCAIGSTTEQGFFYDFSFDFPFLQEHLLAVEEEMKKIVKESLSIQTRQLSKKEAIILMHETGEYLKEELISEISEKDTLTFFRQGEYEELCSGPHLTNTCYVKAIRLLSVAGAYWKGDENNQMLTRIYGISFPKNSQLTRFFAMQEEAKERDHRKLGKELKLFTFLKEAPGFPFFLPKGMILKNLLIDYWREIHKREGYEEISTPMLLEKSLWETSGHWEHYRENMYTTKIDNEDFAIKPMNCPGGMLVYKTEPRSYRDLPLRFAELGLVHRHEKSGQLHGLMWVRCFTQDDAHIFMTKEQITEEIKKIVTLIHEVYSFFGFSFHVELSTRPRNSVGSDEEWNLATHSLEKAIKEMNIPYCVNEGDGAFYGPKLDFHLKDSLGRTWQCGTIQLDFQLPRRFHAEYIGADGEKHCPIMIHRVVFGSLERFIGILTEHYGGKFPAWLSPVQVKLLPVSDKFLPYTKKVEKLLSTHGIRTETDERTEKLGYKIREARLDKVPYMMICGKKEEENQTVSFRCRDSSQEKEQPGEITLEQAIKMIKESI